jgi:predicted dehydrogenase
VKAVRKAGTRFMVAHVIRFWPEYQVLKEYVDRKTLGPVASAVFRRYGQMPCGWKKWFQDARLSCGAALDLHIHDADYVRYLFGEPEKLDSVGALRAGGWDQIVTNYHYPKVAVTAEGGWWPAPEPFEMAFHVVFKNGVLIYSSKNQPLTCYQPGKEPAPVNVPQPKTGDVQAGGNISSLGGYYNEVKYFTDCLKKGCAPQIVTPEDARETIVLVRKEMASAAKKLRK